MKMPRFSQSRIAAFVITGVILSGILTVPGLADNTDPPVLIVSLSDTVAQAGTDDAWISVYLANYQDTLAGFSLWVMADKPDIIEFRTDVVDTIIQTRWWQCIDWDAGQCVDSIPLDPPEVDTIMVPGGIDTTGTVIGGWQYASAISNSPNRSDIKVTALANTLGPPTHPGLAPQDYPVLLLRLRVRVSDDLPFATDSTVHFYIVDNLSETGFSDPSGHLIGTVTNYSIADTTYWQCLDWSGDTCLAWAPSDPENADSVRIDTFYTYWCCDEWIGNDCMGWSMCLPPGDSVSIDSVPWTIIDTNVTFYGNGSLTVISDDFCCQIAGDANVDGLVNVGDPVFLIGYIFRSGPPPSCPWAADCNGDCEINVADVICMIRPIFQIYPWYPPQCAPDSCVYDGY
jgi:hypothetical protein